MGQVCPIERVHGDKEVAVLPVQITIRPQMSDDAAVQMVVDLLLVDVKVNAVIVSCFGAECQRTSGNWRGDDDIQRENWL